MAAEEGRAAIWEIDPATGEHRIFASGLRNPVGLAWQPETGALWTAVNERDELGSDLVPDYMTSVQDGGFYGWPYSYFGDHVDARVEPQRPDLVAKAIVPDYALGAHTASLGLAFADGAEALPPAFRAGAFVGQHGSWNRKPRSGYKVIFVPFEGGRPAGDPVDVLTGFVSEEARRRAARSGSPSTRRARSWSRTTSATASGASRRRRARPRSNSAAGLSRHHDSIRIAQSAMIRPDRTANHLISGGPFGFVGFASRPYLGLTVGTREPSIPYPRNSIKKPPARPVVDCVERPPARLGGAPSEAGAPVRSRAPGPRRRR